MSGLSTSIAAALGEQAEEIKREFSTQRREDLAKQGEAMPDGSYPIPDKDALRRAIQSFGRAKDPEAVKAHIIKRARALGAMDMLPESWNVTKDDEPETIEWKSDGRHETKVMPVTGLKVLDEEQGIIEAFVSVTGIVDRVKDIIEPGAYEKTLAERTPKGVWSHDWASPVSKTIEVKELLPGDPELPKTLRNGDPWPREAGAVKVRQQFNLDGERGRQAFSDVKFFGDEQEWSIGYNVPVGGAVVERKSGIRRIKMLDWFEYSPVLFGAMPEAVSASVKSAQEALRLLREQEEKDAQLTIDETEEQVEEPVEPEAAPEPEAEAEPEVDDMETDDGIDDEQMQLLFDEAAAAIDAEVRAIREKVAGVEATPGDAAAAERLRRYWAEGEGAAKIRWGTPGDWKRCRAHLEKYMGPRANGYCQLLHKRATGIYTGDRANPGNGKADEPEVETKEVDSSDYLTCQKCGGQAVVMVEGKAQCKACGGKVARKFKKSDDEPDETKAAPASAAQMLRDLADAIEEGSDVDRASVESVIKALQSTLNSTQKEPDASPEEPKPEETKEPEKKTEGVNIIGDVMAAARFMVDLDEVVPPFSPRPEGEAKFDPHQPRISAGHAGGGRWASIIGSISRAGNEPIMVGKQDIPMEGVFKAWDTVKHGPGKPNASGKMDDPIDVGDDLDKATELLAQGKHIRLSQPDQVSTLVKRLATIGAEMKKRGADAPDFDLCKISVPGTNLFCHDNKGIPRAEMPQFAGTPKKGSPADLLPKDDKGEVDTSDAFRAALIARGIKVTAATVPASHLRATQNQLVGTKVGGMAKAMEEGKIKEKPIFVTRDHYVLDGHHRFAAKITIDLEDGKLGDITMPVEIVDLDVGEALDLANAFTSEIGIKAKGTGAQADKV